MANAILPDRRRHLAHRLWGIFCVSGILAGVFQFGCSRPEFRFQVKFQESPNLKKGAEIRYLGIPVGQVQRVGLQGLPDGSAQVIAIASLTDRSVQLRSGDMFVVQTAGLLGEEYINIVPGPKKAPMLPSGATVNGTSLGVSLTDFDSVMMTLEMTPVATKLKTMPPSKRHEVLDSIRDLVNKAAGVSGGSTPAPANNQPSKH